MSGHIPILTDALVKALRAQDPAVRRLVDGTVGGGGHSAALLGAGIENALVIDLDKSSIARARTALAAFGERVQYSNGSYLDMGQEMARLGWDKADAILLDLGLSSLQLNDPARGFSFRFDAPLDMRFDVDGGGRTAGELVDELEEGELADLFFRYGEERHARRIARAIAQARPVATAAQLADIVMRAKPAAARRARIHPATRVFQALRIAVNDELASVTNVLPLAIGLLRPGGRLAVISFHSLEDRIVKRQFRALAETRLAPPGMASLGEKRAQIRLVNRKPIVADEAEVRANPRSRSAKLRVVEKL